MNLRKGRSSANAWLALGLLAAAALAALVAPDARLRSLMLSTLWLVGPVTAISAAIGTPLAILLYRTDLPGAGALRTVLGVLLLLPLEVHAAAWQAGFGMQGWATPDAAPPLIDGWRGAVWIHAAAAVPWVVLIVGLALRLTEPELEEDGLLDARWGRVFRRVTLRRALGGVVAAALWVAITTAGDMTVTNIFQVRTLAEETYTAFSLGEDSFATIRSLLPPLAITVWLIIAAMVLVGALAPHRRHETVRAARAMRLGRWRWIASLAAATAVLLLAGVPLASLVYKAGILITPTGDGWTRSWSAAKCAAVIAASPARFSREFGWSLLVGSLAAAVAVVLAAPLAWLARRGGWRAAPAIVVTAACLAVPGPLVGIALVKLFNQPSLPWLVALYDRSIAAPLIAQTIKVLPLAVLVIWHAFNTISDELVEGAASEGAGTLKILLRIVIPERRAAVALAFLVALCVALGELSASILVVPPGVSLLSVQIFGLIHYGVDDYVAGVCLVLIGSVALLTGIAAMLARRTTREALALSEH